MKPIVKPGPKPKCSDNFGKECLPVHKCDLNSTILSSSDPSSLINITENGIVDLDAQANLCNVDNLVCCSRKMMDVGQVPVRGKPKKKPYPHKCGQRHASGHSLRISHPLNGKEATQFGEWPHACILYKKISEKQGSLEFLGGASLIAPGIAVTATHKLMDQPDKTQ
jgi:hypothetical protein